MVNLILFLQTSGLTEKFSPGMGSDAGGLSTLTSDFKALAGILIGIGLTLALVKVIRILISGSESGRKALIGWIVALMVYMGLWAIL